MSPITSASFRTGGSSSAVPPSRSSRRRSASRPSAFWLDCSPPTAADRIFASMVGRRDGASAHPVISHSRYADRSPRMHTTWTIYESPVGPLTLVGGPRGLSRLFFPGHAGQLREERRDDAALADAVGQLEEYFAGRRRHFELDLDLRGTPFQLSVWAQLSAIPHGETRAYGELARAIGRPDRARAVGGAVGRTPIPIIVPCHRAVGADG